MKVLSTLTEAGPHEAPERVEIALKEAFRRHHSARRLRRAMIAAIATAAAACTSSPHVGVASHVKSASRVGAARFFHVGVTSVGVVGFSEGAQNTVLALAQSGTSVFAAGLTFSGPADQNAQIASTATVATAFSEITGAFSSGLIAARIGSRSSGRVGTARSSNKPGSMPR